jgi:hypothetical protein
LDFLNDANPSKGYVQNDDGPKSTYQSKDFNFAGESEIDKLLYKIKA